MAITSLQVKDDSVKALAKHAIPFFKIINRTVGYRYDPKAVKEFKPFDPDITPQESHCITKVFRYVHIGSMLGMIRFEKLEDKRKFFGTLYDYVPDFLKVESRTANEEDNLCFYSSYLMYLMLREDPAIDNKQLKYVQGFIRTKISEIYRLPDGNPTPFMFTCHAFVVYKGIIIDTTIMQVEKYLDFELEKPFVFGSEGYLKNVFTHFGWEEYPQTAMKFAKRIAKLSNIDFNQWLMNHRTHCINFQ